MSKIILIDHKECSGCMMCAMACSFNKTNTFNPARSRIAVVNFEEKGLIVPIVCQHCEEPVCVACCPVDAMNKNEETGLVEIDRQSCINCKICRQVCPFGGPSLDPVEKIVVLCDHCGGNPACVDVCPTGTLQYVTSERSTALGRRSAMGEIRKSLVALGET